MISIIIPTLREGDFLERTLKNLATMGDFPYEVIITDGGSTDQTLDIARRYTQKVVVWDKPRRQTFGEAKNAGAALATGEFLVFIDADVIVPEPRAFFEELLGVFAKNPKLTGITVPLEPFPESKNRWDRTWSAPLNWFYVFSNNILHYGIASGEFQMIPAGVFKHLGGYHEHLAAGEDNNMFYRLSKAGRTLSYRKLEVYHSYRRVRKLGWFRIYMVWIGNGLHVMLFQKAAVKEWSVVR